MKVFLSIKYYDDMRNKNLIEKICLAIENCGDVPFVFAKNVQNYGKCEFSAENRECLTDACPFFSPREQPPYAD